MFSSSISGAILSGFEAALPAGMAVEVFHNFTLLHDDIMDNAGLPLIGVVPDSKDVEKAQIKGVLASEMRRDREHAEDAFDEIAGRLCGKNIPLMSYLPEKKRRKSKKKNTEADISSGSDVSDEKMKEATMLMVLYIWRESAETIGDDKSLANDRLSSVFPMPVGPTSTIRVFCCIKELKKWI